MAALKKNDFCIICDVCFLLYIIFFNMKKYYPTKHPIESNVSLVRRLDENFIQQKAQLHENLLDKVFFNKVLKYQLFSSFHLFLLRLKNADLQTSPNHSLDRHSIKTRIIRTPTSWYFYQKIRKQIWSTNINIKPAYKEWK